MPMCSLLGTVFVLNELMSRERNECLGDHLETFFLSKKNYYICSVLPTH